MVSITADERFPFTERIGGYGTDSTSWGSALMMAVMSYATNIDKRIATVERLMINSSSNERRAVWTEIFEKLTRWKMGSLFYD